ncbi:uncharacterized protein [Narcine bancroftii]|uniref:uncharacterized protein n=1 Tax=Narcine bancroftii TaxID=1343680 RepID=UPI0038322C40
MLPGMEKQGLQQQIPKDICLRSVEESFRMTSVKFVLLSVKCLECIARVGGDTIGAVKDSWEVENNYDLLSEIIPIEEIKNFVPDDIQVYLAEKNIKTWNGLVQVECEVVFQEMATVPSSSDIVRTVVTHVYNENQTARELRIDVNSVTCNGYSLSNLEPARLLIEFTALSTGFGPWLNEPTFLPDLLQRLTSWVVRALEDKYLVQEFNVGRVTPLQGDVNIQGVALLSTPVHVDEAEALAQLNNLVNRFVDLRSLKVNGFGENLGVLPVSFTIKNRVYNVMLKDSRSAYFCSLGKAVSEALQVILKPKYSHFVQAVIKQFGHGSVVLTSCLVFRNAPPDSHEVLDVLFNLVNEDGFLSGTDFKVDAYSFTIGVGSCWSLPSQVAALAVERSRFRERLLQSLGERKMWSSLIGWLLEQQYADLCENGQTASATRFSCLWNCTYCLVWPRTHCPPNCGISGFLFSLPTYDLLHHPPFYSGTCLIFRLYLDEGLARNFYAEGIWTSLKNWQMEFKANKCEQQMEKNAGTAIVRRRLAVVRGPCGFACRESQTGILFLSARDEDHLTVFCVAEVAGFMGPLGCQSPVQTIGNPSSGSEPPLTLGTLQHPWHSLASHFR